MCESMRAILNTAHSISICLSDHFFASSFKELRSNRYYPWLAFVSVYVSMYSTISQIYFLGLWNIQFPYMVLYWQSDVWMWYNYVWSSDYVIM